jgi:hypothetical protein
MHTQKNTTQSNKHRHTHADTQRHASRYIYTVATIAKLGAISVFGIGRMRRQKSDRLLPRRTYRSSSVPRIQGRENGERVTGIWRRSGRCSVEPEILLHEKYEKVYLFSFIYLFIIYISPCMNVGNLIHQAVVYFILFYLGF